MQFIGILNPIQNTWVQKIGHLNKPVYYPERSDFKTRKQFLFHLVLGQNAEIQFAKYVALRSVSTICSKQSFYKKALRSYPTRRRPHKVWLHCTVDSAKAEITFPRADRDLLMFLASSSSAPSAPVLLTWHRYTHKSN